MQFRCFLVATLIGVLGLFSVSPLDAAIDAYPFPDEQMRLRYQRLINQLRCPTCLNTNLAGSDAMIAKDLRREVHRLILEGRRDDEVLDFMRDRYGDFILYNPRLTPGTAALWFGPPLLLILALAIGFRVARNKTVVAALTARDKSRLAQLILPDRKDP